jgi:apolipoprotein N-acyltransferase
VTPRTALARALAVAGGAGLYALALPPADVAALAWLTLVPLLLAVRDSRPRAAFGLGALYGFVAAATVTWWLVPALAAYFGRSLLFAALAMSAAYALAVSATCGTFAAGASVLLRQGPWPVAAATVPALWVTIELVRGRVLGEPWALLGYTQHAAVGLIQTAALAGVYGLSYLVALGNVALAEATARLVARGGLRPAAAALAGPAAVIAAVWLGGAAVVPAPSRARATVPVAVVQANVPPAFEWTRAYAEHQLLAELEATARVPAASHPALIVWPENAITLYLENEPLVAAALERLAARTGADLIVGAPRREANRTYNSARLFRADGRPGGRYDKRRLVAFAEAPPLGAAPPPAPGATPRAFVPGTTPGVLASFAPLGLSICHEILYPEVIDADVARGAELLVNIANDGWLDGGHGVGSRQHAAMAALRAVETRRYLVRAATTGVSAIVDPWGRIVTSAPPDTTAVLTAPVAARRGLTPYVRLGDAFAFACAGGVVVVFARRRVYGTRPVVVPAPAVG